MADLMMVHNFQPCHSKAIYNTLNIPLNNYSTNKNKNYSKSFARLTLLEIWKEKLNAFFNMEAKTDILN